MCASSKLEQNAKDKSTGSVQKLLHNIALLSFEKI
ncbi:hypothetical protein T06_1948 [Trichinella sp. T6]|nr:hypothetical protein T06_1948 [Trichinella sp. T6]